MMKGRRSTVSALGVACIGLLVSAFIWIGFSEVGAAESTISVGSPAYSEGPQQGTPQSPEVSAPATKGPHAPTSTLPLRWRVSWATYETGSFDTFCGTVVLVTNTTNASVNVEVEWMDLNGTSQGLNPLSVPAYGQRIWSSSNNVAPINNVPWNASACPQGCSTQNPDFRGYALVTSADPRIMATSFQYCRTAVGFSGPTILAHTTIPTFPVGATLEYFQAGLPTHSSNVNMAIPEQQ